MPDAQLTSADWAVDAVAIDGVVAKSVTNVLTDNGFLTELWRADWNLDSLAVGQVFQRTLNPGTISAWHVHQHTVDRLSCASGRLLVVLFDARIGSPTHGSVAEYRLGEHRPATICVPPGVFHGVRNIGGDKAVIINAVDIAYDYARPDHLRVPADSPDIPYRW